MREWTKEEKREFSREMLYSACLSVLWCAVAGERGMMKPEAKDKLIAAGFSKAELGKLFQSSRHRISLRRMADMAEALGLRVEVALLEPQSGLRYTPSGIQR